jgi:hypothetical protein
MINLYEDNIQQLSYIINKIKLSEFHHPLYSSNILLNISDYISIKRGKVFNFRNKIQIKQLKQDLKRNIANEKTY